MNNKCPKCGAIIYKIIPGDNKCIHCGAEYYVTKDFIIKNKATDKKVTYRVVLIAVTIFAIVLVLFATRINGRNYYYDSYYDEEEKQEYVNYSSYIDAKIGDFVLFGSYEQDDVASNGSENIEWMVLNRTEDGVLLISRYGLDSKKFNEEFEFTTWNDCDIRTWLNTEFYSNAFSEEEKKHISTTQITTEYACKEASYDKVFLLSYSEAEKYFEDDNSRITKATTYAIANGVNAYDDSSCYWWLRSLCEDNEYVMNVRSTGTIRYAPEKSVNDEGYAVRPAIWVNYEEIIEQKNTEETENNSVIIEILDESMNIYIEPNKTSTKNGAVYKGERYACLRYFVSGAYSWYEIETNKWVGDGNGTRVKLVSGNLESITIENY